MGRGFLAAIGPRVVALTILGLACGGCGAAGDESSAPELRVEASGGTLTIYVDDPAGDAAAIPVVGPGGVAFVCMDGDGGVLLRRKLKWPFTDTDGGTDIAHGHVGLEGQSLGRIARCRLVGLESGPLEGSPSIAF